MPPPAWFFTAITAMVGLHVFLPGPVLVPDPWTLLGLALVAAGVALNFAAVAAFRRRATTTDPDGAPAALVSDGPYRLSRNPMYAGGVLILLGFAVLLGSALPFLVPPLYGALAASDFVPREERKLAAAFGDEWRAYTARVRRWL